MLGTTLSHYRLIERLGEGGMGEVFLVEDLKLHRKAALTLISADLTRDETRRQRFLQEARLAASIDHPHIAAVHDIGEVDGRTYIAMEYVEGRSLRDVLKDGALKLRRALDLAIEAGDALAKVHQHGVIHRDLKPENLLITNDWYLKIIDFGLAKLVDPLAQTGLADAATIPEVHVRTADGVILGTMGYMSPEQVRGASVDARSDIFSFGAVLYEMVSGTPPFRKGSGAETISAILNEAPALPRIDDPALGAELQRVLRKCLAKDPGARYQGVRDLVVDLRALRESVGTSDTAPRSVEAMPAVAAAVAPTRSPYVLVGGAVLIAVLAVGAWWAGGRRGGEPVTGQAAAPARPAVAVMAFEVVSGGSDVAWLGKGLPSLLVTGLAQTPDLEVIGNERLSEAARQMGTTIESVERSRLGELAKRAGARLVLNGTIVQAGADLRIDARVEDLESGAVKLATSVRGPDALALVDDLAARVRSGLNVQVASESVRKVAEVSSASVEAYRAFTIAAEAQANNRTGDAQKMFEETVRLDPNFGLAYFHLAGLANFQGRPAEGRRLRGIAAQQIDRMSERDATLVRAGMAVDEGRLDESRQLLEDLVARYPDTEMAWMGLPATAEDPARRETILARAVAALPYSPVLHNIYGYALLHNGRIDEALRAFHTYVKLRPAEPNALDSLAEGYLVAGDVPNALDRYEAAIKGGYTGSPAGRAWTMAVAGRYPDALQQVMSLPPRGSIYRSFVLSRLGRYREAERELDVARGGAQENAFTEMIVALDLVSAMYALERRDCAAVGRRVEAAEKMAASLDRERGARWLLGADLLAGSCDVRESRLAAARQRLAHARSIAQAAHSIDRSWTAVLDGEITLVERFMANNLVQRDGRARAAVAQGKLDEAIALYRGLLTPGPQQKWTAMLDPLHVIALARVLDKAGQRDAARAEYQRFLEYWKDADKDLPELSEARAALTR